MEQAGELSCLLEKKYVTDMISKAKKESEAKIKAYEENLKKENLDKAISDLVHKYELVVPETEKADKKVGGKGFLVNRKK